LAENIILNRRKLQAVIEALIWIDGAARAVSAIAMKLKAAPSLSDVNLWRDLEETIVGQRANHKWDEQFRARQQRL